MNARFEEKLKVIPEIPKQFGEDGGHFYRYYDALADEIDEDIVKSLKSQLDGILIFAGLFAGVNSAFLALTLPEMSADPADDTNALLLQLVTGGNGSIHSADDLPSASFSPTSSILPVNILFSLSLTLALLAAFLAVLGQQWLVYYRKRSGGGAEAQRWEQLRRYLGAKRWRLEAILDDILPSLLQLGLVIFSISFVLYLGTLSGPMCYTVAVPMGLALTCIVLMALGAACDNWSKFAWRTVLLHLSWASKMLSKGKHCIITTARLLDQRNSRSLPDEGQTGSVVSPGPSRAPFGQRRRSSESDNILNAHNANFPSTFGGVPSASLNGSSRPIPPGATALASDGGSESCITTRPPHSAPGRLSPPLSGAAGTSSAFDASFNDPSPPPQFNFGQVEITQGPIHRSSESRDTSEDGDLSEGGQHHIINATRRLDQRNSHSPPGECQTRSAVSPDPSRAPFGQRRRSSESDNILNAHNANFPSTFGGVPSASSSNGSSRPIPPGATAPASDGGSESCITSGPPHLAPGRLSPPLSGDAGTFNAFYVSFADPPPPSQLNFGQVVWSAIRSCTSRALTTFRRAVRFISKVTQDPIYRPIPGSTASWLAENVPRRAEPVGRLKSMAAKRIICTSEDTNALVYAAVNMQAITSPEEAGWLLSDDEFDSRLRESWKYVCSIEGGIQSTDPRAVPMVAFSNSLLHLILSSGVTSILPPGERSSVSSHSLDENTDVTDFPWDFRVIGYALPLMADFGVQSSCPHCAHCLMTPLVETMIRCSSLPLPQIEMDNWFEQFSTSLVHFTEEPPMLICLLACAVQAYGKLESRPGYIVPYVMEGCWTALYKMCNIYQKRDAEQAVHYALEVFPTVDSPSRPSDGVCVMLLERARAVLKPGSGPIDDLKLIVKYAMDLFQKIMHQETWDQLSQHPENDLVVRCTNVLVWAFAHIKVSFVPVNAPRLAVDLWSELKVCLDSVEQISTTKHGTVHLSAFLNFLRIRDELLTPAEYAEIFQDSLFKPDVDPSKYYSFYDELVTCFAQLESTILAVQRNTDPVMANPADPLPIRVVDGEDGPRGNSADGKNPLGDSFSCHLFL